MAEFTTAIQKLEFHKVVERLCQLVVSEPGRELAKTLHPSISRQEIEAKLGCVSEAKELLIAEGAVPLDGTRSILPSLKKSSVENQILSVQELLDVASTLRTARMLNVFLSKRRNSYLGLAQFIPRLFFDKVIEFNIEQALDESGIVRETASKELKTIRQDIIAVSDTLRERLTEILQRVSQQEFLQEEIITTRDGRMVIPVKVEHKNHVPGFIHSSSASGATVYIEPAETLEINNALRELQIREQREIERILRELTKQVSVIHESLEQSLKTLAELDLIFAKAKYSIEILGNAPKLFDQKVLKLVEARHPVLLQRHSREEVVPLDLQLGGEARTLIITGPNAGGKSVTMKTVGLLTLCVQAGLHIPASDESEFYVFEKIFVDIGDDQSIEKDLSTFSSHLIRLQDIVTQADEKSLVLVDEIGVGTDPSEGVALAFAVLQELTNKKTITITTTHHGMLKAFAHETPGVINGSMEFDQTTLRPTYRFRLGIPGSSYALELAERMGMPQDILRNARQHLGEEKSKLESLLVDLERQSQYHRQQMKELASERDLLRELVESYEQKMTELKKEIAAMRRKAAEEARDIVKKAQGLIERTVKEIRESAAEKSVVHSVRHRVQEIQKEIETSVSPVEQKKSIQDFVVGDFVRLQGGTEAGELVEIQDSMATVAWGSARLRVPLEDLVKDRQPRPTVQSISRLSFAPEAKSEIDVRGLFGDDAITKIQNFLDNAYVVGLHRVDVIHGKGTGALRKRVTEFLKTYPHVKSFRLGEWNEGGIGVTVVELND